MKSVVAISALLLLGLCSAEKAASSSVVGGGLRGGFFAAVRQRQQHAAASPEQAATAAPEQAATAASEQADATEDVAVSSSVPADEVAMAEAEADTIVDSSPAATPLADDAAGPDGFPVLPAISAMSGSALETLKSVSSQASVLEARLAQTQKENQEKLVKQKTIFEGRLKSQEEANRGVVAANTDINRNIEALREGNGNLTNHAKELRVENRLKRTELATLKAKISLATEFVAESLKATDDKAVAALAVLKTSVVTHEKIALVATAEDNSLIAQDKDDDEDSDKQDNEDDDEDAETSHNGDDEGADSFLALSMKVHRMSAKQSAELELDEFSDSELFGSRRVPSPPANPKDLIGALYSGVDTLSKQGDANIAHLKALFVAAFKKGSHRHSVLVEQQKALNSTRSGLQSTKAKLQGAVSHLEGTHKNLDERLRGIGNFLRRLGHLGSAPGSEAKRILKTLPDKISPQKAPSDTGVDAGAAPDISSAD